MVEKGDNKEKKEEFVRWFSELNNKDIGIAGGKGASLAEMYRNKFPIPPGFVVTAQAYRHFIEKSGIGKRIKDILEYSDVEKTKELDESSKKIREIIEKAEMPKELQSEILEAYEILDVDKGSENARGTALEILQRSHEPPFVAVRSSATTEDLVDASFAGQQESFLNVKGGKELIKKVKACFSSLFTARAIYYRTKKGFPHDKSYLAVVIQKMVNSEKSGVMFSMNPINRNDEIMIEAVWGLGEGIVSGMIKPDNYVIQRDLSALKIKETKVSEKKIAIVRDSSGENKVIKLTEEKSNQQVLSDYEIKNLSQYALRLEEHYGKPQDIEFAIENREIFIVQSRPITTKAQEKGGELSGEVLLSGLGASPGVGSGVVKIIHSLSELEKVKKGDILVAEMTNPDMVVSMQKASGIVTDEGGITSHAAIVSREMGIPAVVGTGNATKKLKDGMIITVDGNSGKVINGRAEEKKVVIEPIVKTKTKIKVIVDLPDFAERAALTKCSGIGLVRLEGIIAECGRHPLYFVREKKINDYQNIIYLGLEKISEHFEEIWVRTSDIRNDEYRNLEGAPKEIEGNPMLGDHGVRFSLKHKEIMISEINALKELCLKFKSKNFGIMVPQLINLEELKKTKEIAQENGKPENLKIGIMVETPAAVQIINDLCEEGIDFISFGTNDLTQYTLAIDRNNENIQDLYDESNPAVLNSIKYVIRRCKKYGVETSICGQAASKEEIVKFLIEEGIDSLSVNADAAAKVSKLVLSLENNNSKNQNETYESREESAIIDGIESRNGSDNESEERVMEISAENKNIEDIESVILRELENDEYTPGETDMKKDIPSLNDSIPLDSDDFES